MVVSPVEKLQRTEETTARLLVARCYWYDLRLLYLQHHFRVVTRPWLTETVERKIALLCASQERWWRHMLLRDEAIASLIHLQERSERLVMMANQLTQFRRHAIHVAEQLSFMDEHEWHKIFVLCQRQELRNRRMLQYDEQAATLWTAYWGGTTVMAQWAKEFTQQRVALAEREVAKREAWQEWERTATDAAVGLALMYDGFVCGSAPTPLSASPVAASTSSASLPLPPLSSACSSSSSSGFHSMLGDGMQLEHQQWLRTWATWLYKGGLFVVQSLGRAFLCRRAQLAILKPLRAQRLAATVLHGAAKAFFVRRFLYETLSTKRQRRRWAADGKGANAVAVD